MEQHQLVGYLDNSVQGGAVATILSTHFDDRDGNNSVPDVAASFRLVYAHRFCILVAGNCNRTWWVFSMVDDGRVGICVASCTC